MLTQQFSAFTLAVCLLFSNVAVGDRNTVGHSLMRLQTYPVNPPTVLLGAEFYTRKNWALKLRDVLTSPFPKKQNLEVVIYHLNDFHNTIKKTISVKGPDGVRKKIKINTLSIITETVKRHKANAQPNQLVLFVSSGDDHIGSVYDLLYRQSTRDSPSFSLPYLYYNTAQMDAAAVGNHELDKGLPPFLTALRKDAQFPIVSANLSSNRLPVPWAAIKSYNGFNVGFIGLTAQDEIYVNLPTQNPITVLKKTVNALKNQVDFLVVLSHLGIRDRFDKTNDLIVAQLLETIDTPSVVIGGHTHEQYPPVQHGADITRKTPIVQTAGKAKQLGKLVLTLQKTANNHYQIIKAHTDPIDLMQLYDTLSNSGYNTSAHGQVDRVLENMLAQALNENIGALTPELAAQLVDDNINQNRFLNPNLPIATFMNNALLRHFQRPESNLQHMIKCRKGIRCKVISAFNGSGINGLKLTPGQTSLSYGQWYDTMPYADTVFVYRLPVDAFKRLLQDNAARFKQYRTLENSADLLIAPKQDVLHFSSNLQVKLVNNLPVYDTLSATDEIVLLLTSYIAVGRGGWGSYFGVGGQFTHYRTHDTQLTYRKQIIAYIKTLKAAPIAHLSLQTH